MRADTRRPAAIALALALALPGVAAALEFDTFFHTPEERARLDRARRGEPAIPIAGPGPGRAEGPAVTGYVQRSDGHNTLWIDGRPVATTNPKATPLFDPRKVRDGSDRLPESAVVPSAPAKPGSR